MKLITNRLKHVGTTEPHAPTFFTIEVDRMKVFIYQR